MHTSRWQKYILRGFQYAISLLWAFFALFPIYWVITSSLKEPKDVFATPPKWFFKPTLHNYEVVLGLKIPKELEGVTEELAGEIRSEFIRYLMNTLFVSVGSTFLSLAIGSLSAYALARGPLAKRKKRVVLGGILITQLIPPVVLLIPIYVLWQSLKLLHTHTGLIVAYLSLSLPFTIWMMYSFFVELPVELEEAAMVDGCSRWQSFEKITLPLSAPGLVVTAIFVFITTWNEFLFSSVLAGEAAKTISPSILIFITDKAILWGRLYAAGSAILLPILLFTFLVQKYIGIGMTSGALKG
jgi:multiple sugar transport system permease protein